MYQFPQYSSCRDTSPSSTFLDSVVEGIESSDRHSDLYKLWTLLFLTLDKPDASGPELLGNAAFAAHGFKDLPFASFVTWTTKALQSAVQDPATIADNVATILTLSNVIAPILRDSHFSGPADDAALQIQTMYESADVRSSVYDLLSIIFSAPGAVDDPSVRVELTKLLRELITIVTKLGLEADVQPAKASTSYDILGRISGGAIYCWMKLANEASAEQLHLLRGLKTCISPAHESVYWKNFAKLPPLKRTAPAAATSPRRSKLTSAVASSPAAERIRRMLTESAAADSTDAEPTTAVSTGKKRVRPTELSGKLDRDHKHDGPSNKAKKAR